MSVEVPHTSSMPAVPSSAYDLYPSTGACATCTVALEAPNGLLASESVA